MRPKIDCGSCKALYFHTKVPNWFRVDCVQFATHLVNRIPLQVLYKLLPFKKYN